MNQANFRLDWHREAEKLAPFFNGRPGVVRIDFESEDAAADKFNYFITEEFENRKGNGQRLSLRLDDDWSTTKTVDDQIFAIARKLESSGIVIDWSQKHGGGGDWASGNQSGGNINIDISNVVISNGMDTSPHGIQKRLELVCDAMAKFVSNGGHFMLIVNDMKCQDQGNIWKNIWSAGLRVAGGANLSLVYYVGTRCGQNPHVDAPIPDEVLVLPHSIETDDGRQGEVFDDATEILQSKCVYTADEARAAANMLIDSNSDSVRRLHTGLFKTLMKAKSRS